MRTQHSARFAALLLALCALPAHAQTYSSRAITIAEVQRILANATFRERALDPYMFQPLPGSPAEFAGTIRADVRKWGRVMREANIKLD